MKTPLAILNLWHQGAKTLVNIGGVAFALLLVFMQLGFMGAVSSTATNVLEGLQFDVMLRARNYQHLYEPGQLDRKWLKTVQGMDGVQRVAPFWVTIQNWRALPTAVESQPGAADSHREEFASQYLPIAVMAVDPNQAVFVDPQIQKKTQLLNNPSDILLDDSTQKDYGPWDGKRFNKTDFGRKPEIGGREYRIIDLFKLGTGLAANGAVISNQTGFAQITPWDVSRVVSMGLVQVQDDSPESVNQVVAEIRRRASINPAQPSSADGTPPAAAPKQLSSFFRWLGFPPELPDDGVVEVLSRQDVLARETYRWLWQTPIGLIFQLGVVLSLMVGAAIVYMVLSTDVANRLPEYATLLAMGYSRKYLASIVMTQALALCGLGFLTAWASAELLYRLTTVFSSIPMSMTLERVIMVSILGVVMCCLSGLLALRKLWKAEPASLF